MARVKNYKINPRDLCAVALAAGKGTRMKSSKPKVLQHILDEPMLWYIYETLNFVVDMDNIWTVVGHKVEQLQREFPKHADNFIVQEQQLGTGHALKCVNAFIQNKSYSWCIVINGDTPLIDYHSLLILIQETITNDAEMSFMTTEMENPYGYGRVVRNREGKLKAIVEDQDYTDQEELKDINEVNTGLYCFNLEKIQRYLPKLTKDNKKQEYYITQLVDLCVKEQGNVIAVKVENHGQFQGINSPKELVECEIRLQQQIVNTWQREGVIIRNPDQVRIGPKVQIQPGTELTGPVELYGESRLESGASIDSHVWIKDSVLNKNCKVKSFTHVEGVIIGQECEVGPFARLRPQTELKQKARVGNFVEVKKSVLKEGCKANHLAYLGDAEIGEATNVGAGTITCNYDGKQKHKTTIGKKVFIGSNTSLVAPISIGDNSLIGAGSTITKDVPEEILSVARAKQKNLVLKKIKK